jgi:ketosteroid isomerase-like protein
MKKLVSIVPLALLLCFTFSCKDSESVVENMSVMDLDADKVAIRDVWKQVVVLFNNHDAKGLAALFDPVFERWEGNVKGPAEEQKALGDYFEQQKEIQYKQLEEIGLIFITPKVAIYKTYGEVLKELDAEENEQSPSKIVEAWVFVKRNGQWKIASYFLDLYKFNR